MSFTTEHGTVLDSEGRIDHAATARLEREKRAAAERDRIAEWAGYRPDTADEWKDLYRSYARALAAEARARVDARRAADRARRSRDRLS